MSSFPEPHELTWFFETDPVQDHDDLTWEAGVTFRTVRDAWEVTCSFDPYDGSVEIEASVDQRRAIYFKLPWGVDTMRVDRRGDQESLLIRPLAGYDLKGIRLQLKPHVSLTFEGGQIWDRRKDDVVKI